MSFRNAEIQVKSMVSDLIFHSRPSVQVVCSTLVR